MKIAIKILSHHTLLIQWEKVEPDQINAIREFLHDEFEEILETVPAFKELAIYLHFGINIDDFHIQLEKKIKDLTVFKSSATSKIYQIPVCYDPDFGIDLQAMAKAKNLSREEVIKLHTEPIYKIHFLGFLPGFPYLSGLPSKIHQARLASPRREIADGSVGIAGDQSGIYPQASPGGWNIIGRTPLKLFDIQQNPPALLEAGNRLQFYSIGQKEYQSIKKAVEAGKYDLNVADD